MIASPSPQPPKPFPLVSLAWIQIFFFFLVLDANRSRSSRFYTFSCFFLIVVLVVSAIFHNYSFKIPAFFYIFFFSLASFLTKCCSIVSFSTEFSCLLDFNFIDLSILCLMQPLSLKPWLYLLNLSTYRNHFSSTVSLLFS